MACWSCRCRVPDIRARGALRNSTGMTVGLFLGDLLKQLLLLLVFGVPLALAALWLMERAGAQWWLYLWLLWSGFTLFMIWAYPALIAPLFNKFHPAQRQDPAQAHPDPVASHRVQGPRVFVMDGSRRSRTAMPISPVSTQQAHRVLRHPAHQPARPRDRGGARARARSLPSPPYRQAHRCHVCNEPGGARAARLAGAAAVVYAGLGVSTLPITPP